MLRTLTTDCGLRTNSVPRFESAARSPQSESSVAETGPKLTRPRALLVLIMVLCWEAGRGIEGLVLPERSTAFHFFRALGLTPVHFVVEAITVAVALAALGYIWRARPGWVQSALVALGYFAAQAIVVTLFMLRFVDRARTAFLASRAARGQPVDPGRVEQLFAMGWLEWRLVMSLTFFGVAAWLAWRRRAYVGTE
jgi:hypothetical protein